MNLKIKKYLLMECLVFYKNVLQRAIVLLSFDCICGTTDFKAIFMCRKLGKDFCSLIHEWRLLTVCTSGSSKPIAQ